MYKLTLVALLLSLTFSCKSNSQSDVPASNDIQSNTSKNTKEMNPAIKYGIELAAEGIRSVIEAANGDDIELYKGRVLYNAMAIQHAIKFCKEQNETELGEKLIVLDNRVSKVFADEDKSNQQKWDEIRAVCNDLDAFLK